MSSEAQSSEQDSEQLAGLRGEAERAAINEKEISSRDARIACLEHGLRYAADKFDWLASFHVSSKFSRDAAKELSREVWKLQAGEITMIGIKIS